MADQPDLIFASCLNEDANPQRVYWVAAYTHEGLKWVSDHGGLLGPMPNIPGNVSLPQAKTESGVAAVDEEGFEQIIEEAEADGLHVLRRDHVR